MELEAFSLENLESLPNLQRIIRSYINVFEMNGRVTDS